jgi:hypothetical protein
MAKKTQATTNQQWCLEKDSVGNNHNIITSCQPMGDTTKIQDVDAGVFNSMLT